MLELVENREVLSFHSQSVLNALSLEVKPSQFRTVFGLTCGVQVA